MRAVVSGESKLDRSYEVLAPVREGTALTTLVARHWLLLACTVVSLFFTLTGMDQAYLSIGEANTAQLGKNVLLFGYPKAWDGNFLVVPFYDGTINEQLAWVAHPWLQYYLAAGGIALFGPTSLGARFLFVICGALTIVGVYCLAKRVSGNESVVRFATIIFAFHPVVWLYDRQSRYYAPTMLLLTLVPLAYLRWREKPGVRRLLLFVLASVLLFHSLYTIWAFVMAGVGLFYLFFDRRSQTIRMFAAAVLLIAILTLPWFLYAPPHFYFNQTPTADGYLNRLAVHLWKIQTLFYPFLTLAVILVILRFVNRIRSQAASVSYVRWTRESLLFLPVVAYVFWVLIYPFYTTHYMLPVLPFGAIVTAHLLARIREHQRWIGSVTLALLLATNVLHLVPFIGFEKLGVNPNRLESFLPNPTATMTVGTPLSHYLTEQLKIRFYAFDIYDLSRHEHRHQLKCVTDFLRENAAPNQTIQVPWNDATAVSFYTGLKVVYESESPFLRNERLKALLAKPARPDWIVPLAIDMPGQIYLSDLFHPDYEQIPVQCPKEYFETYPNLEFFNFRTNQQAPSWFYILKKQGANYDERSLEAQ